MNRTDPHCRARRGALVVALLVALASAAAAQVADGVIGAGEYPNRLSLADGDFLLFWAFAGDTAHFGIQSRTEGWVALGVGAGDAMDGADITIGWADGGGGPVRDAFATGPFGPHPPDAELGGSDDLASSAARQADGVTTVEFSRSLAAADRYDKPIDPTGAVAVIWAISASDDPRDPHVRRGSALLEPGGSEAGIDAEAAVDAEAADSGSLYALLVPAHTAAMSASFLLLLGGMLFPRFFKHRKWWLKVHRRVGVAGGVLGLLGVGLATYAVARTTGVHLRLPHSWVGLVTIVLIVATPVYGQMMLKIRTKTKRYRSVHRWTGRVTLLAMGATIVLGLFAFGVL